MPKLQFSIKSILLITAIVASACYVAFFTPTVIQRIAAFFAAMVIPAITSIGALYGKKDAQAFCVGALFPQGVMVIYAARKVERLPGTWHEIQISIYRHNVLGTDYNRDFFWHVVILTLASFVIGLICVYARRWFVSE